MEGISSRTTLKRWLRSYWLHFTRVRMRTGSEQKEQKDLKNLHFSQKSSGHELGAKESVAAGEISATERKLWVPSPVGSDRAEQALCTGMKWDRVKAALRAVGNRPGLTLQGSGTGMGTPLKGTALTAGLPVLRGHCSCGPCCSWWQLRHHLLNAGL